MDGSMATEQRPPLLVIPSAGFPPSVAKGLLLIFATTHAILGAKAVTARSQEREIQHDTQRATDCPASGQRVLESTW